MITEVPKKPNCLCSGDWSYLQDSLLSTAAVRPAGLSAPDVQWEGSWWDSLRKKNITARATDVIERAKRGSKKKKKKWKQDNSRTRRARCFQIFVPTVYCFFCEWLKGHLMVSDGPMQLHTSLIWKQNWWHVWKGSGWSGLQVQVSASRLLYDWNEDALVSFSLLELELRLWRTEKRHVQLLWETIKKKRIKIQKVMLWSQRISSASAECKKLTWVKRTKTKNSN